MLSFDDQTFSDLKRQVELQLTSAGRPVPATDRDWRILFALLPVFDAQSAFHVITSNVDGGQGGQPDYNLMVPGTRFHLNVKLSALAAAAITLDIFLTSGVASGVLSLTGHIKPTLTALKVEQGDLCVVSEIAKMRPKEDPADAVFSSLSGRPCSYSHLSCAWRVDGICTISSPKVSATIDDLVEKSVLELRKDGWRSSF